MNTLVIAEIGINHNGSIELAVQMTNAAVEAGATAVKFQLHLPEHEMAPCIKRTKDGKFLYSILEDTCLSISELKALKTHCEEIGVLFLVTPFSVESVFLLESLNVDIYKIGSGETSDLFLLEKIVQTNKKILLSTGMSTMKEVRRSVEFLKSNSSDFVLMQCTSEYPSPFSKINLNVLKTFQNEFGCPVGLSDHSPSIYPSVASVAIGATVVEKHFTTDRSLPGPDQSASLVSNEFKSLVEAIKITELSMGEYDKKVEVNENVRCLFMHSIIAACDIDQGDEIRREFLSSKRPSRNGIPVLEYVKLIGKRARRKILNNEQIRWEDVI